jgi:hypothetical protein
MPLARETTVTGRDGNTVHVIAFEDGDVQFWVRDRDGESFVELQEDLVRELIAACSYGGES